MREKFVGGGSGDVCSVPVWCELMIDASFHTVFTLMTCSNIPEFVQTQKKHGVDAIITDKVTKVRL